MDTATYVYDYRSYIMARLACILIIITGLTSGRNEARTPTAVVLSYIFVLRENLNGKRTHVRGLLIKFNNKSFLYFISENYSIA